MTKRIRTPHPILIAAASVVITSGLISIGHAVDRDLDAAKAEVPSAHHATSSPHDAFAESNARMHRAMSIPATGDVDRDFAKGMMAHHQGAVEMARIELAKGRDPEMRRMAQSVIDSQSREIEHMREWLNSDDHETAPHPHGSRP